MSEFSKVAVLMATYNGEKWIRSQIESIINQENVKLEILIRDDGSLDNTLNIINSYQNKYPIKLILNESNNKSATSNFISLILNTKDNYDYYAFSDQDDWWVSNKLIRAIKILETKKCEAYSSNVSILKNQKITLMNKSNQQKKYDFIFESVPGHTILLSKKSFLNIKKKLISLDPSELKMIDFHDRFIYFYLRSINTSWYIDKISLVHYRQHENNVLGVNYGIGISKEKINGLKKRYNMIRSGYYRSSILNLAKVLNFNNWVLESLDRLNFYDKIKLIFNIYNFRRSRLDCFLLILIIMMMKKNSSE